MTVRPIVQLGDPVLRQTAKKVHRIDGAVRRLIDDMIDSLREAQGSGLAAPQIGVPLRLIITNLEELRVLINPEIISLSEETEIAEEACLSIAGYAGPVERSVRCEVRALNERGKKVKVKGEHWLARCLLHEVDHLNGVLYIDHIEDKSTIHAVSQTFEVEPDHDGDEPGAREQAPAAGPGSITGYAPAASSSRRSKTATRTESTRST